MGNYMNENEKIGGITIKEIENVIKISNFQKKFDDENLNDFPKVDVKRLILLEQIKSNLSDCYQYLSFEELEQLKTKEFFEAFKDIVKQKLRKTEKLNPEKVVNELSNLPLEAQSDLLKEILLWSDRQIREYREDFGYNSYGIVLRYIKDLYLVKDLKIAIDNKWLVSIWDDCIVTNQLHVFTEKMIEYVENNNRNITESDLNFLLSACFINQPHIKYTTEAIRTIATLIENKHIQPQTDTWIKLLTHPNEIVRCAVVEAIWQCRDMKAFPYIRELYLNETSEHCKKTCKHVIEILSK